MGITLTPGPSPSPSLREIVPAAVIRRARQHLDRSLSWVVQHAWRLAFEEVVRFSGADHAPVVPAGIASVRSLPSAAREPRPGSAPELEPGSQVREFLEGKFDRSSNE